MVAHIAHLHCDDSAPRLARRWVGTILDDMRRTRDPPPGFCLEDDLVLCVSELVSASLLASCTMMFLRLTADRESLWISLVDDWEISIDQTDPVMHAQRFALETIDRIADVTGMRRVPGGREVWAVFLGDATPVLPMLRGPGDRRHTPAGREQSPPGQGE